MNNNSDFRGPLTSFDWNPADMKTIATSSLDTTVTIWDIEKQGVITQLVAHDSAVHDIQFAERQRFGTVGNDGSVRVFDLRQLEQSTIIFELENKPLMKLAWNLSNKDQLAVIPQNSTEVYLLDQRKPSQIVGVFKNKSDESNINSICWHPDGVNKLCTVSQAGKVLIYEVE